MSRFAGREGPIRLGMVGGGQGAMIGAVHRTAARLDVRYELVAGALSSTPQKAQASGREIGLQPDRIYDDFTQMANREAQLSDGIEAVAIVTPNHLHLPAARAFLKRGIHVICDKPLTGTMADAQDMQAAVKDSDALFILTHTYAGYPLVREAAERVARGDLGDIRLVQVEYAQDWLSQKSAPTNKQAAWRTDPARSGMGGAISDIGTHAWHLLCHITGLQPEALAADLQSFVPDRQLDDNAHVMLRFAGGARGMLWCSQVAAGQENNLRIRIFGTKAGLDWAQENPNRLILSPLGEPARMITTASPATGENARRLTRVPPGHPEGYFEAFANLYCEAEIAIRAHRTGAALPDGVQFPTLADGMSGMRFVQACVQSSTANSAWVTL